jgi:D-tyrosyl-tRNA(Tyr) deacylase
MRTAACPAMRAVLQRVLTASVTVDDEVVGRIDRPGLCVLVGVTHSDDAAVAERMAAKIFELRVLRDERSAAEVGAPLLVISQFTLYGDARKGRRPTWNAAAGGDVAEPLVDHLVATLRERGAHVETGRFGADMQVELVNDGPTTVILDM